MEERDLYVSVSEVVSNSRYRSQFRKLSRDTSGETYDPPESDKLFFGYAYIRGEKKVVGAASYKPRKPDNTTKAHCSQGIRRSHEITYLFVDPYHQGKGVGKKLIEFVEKHAQKIDATLPITLESAQKAVGFFEKVGYTVTGDPKECVQGGSSLFRKIVPMEKTFRASASSDWPGSTEGDWY